MKLPTRRGVRRAAALVAAGVLLTACSGTGTPEGWMRLERGWLAVDAPEELIEVPEEQAGAYDLVLQDTRESPDVQLAAATEYGTASARSTLTVVRLESPFGRLDEGDEFSEVETDGDRELWRWDFTYEDGAYQGVGWAAHDSETERTVVVALTGKDLADQTVQQVEQSIEVRTG
ncbi:hypothetical protein [Georgenia sp. SYP-B2076]|uniref:hypothetical protein n=1 Tax=Georgenia sp. SYP-B2076 TaxID=2495881 RepID=UPI000F8F57C7|nr:hypothetical protein [Georgenia sp. SYP-B2076]